jgi:hypothetical protein
MTPDGQQFLSYDCPKLAGLLKLKKFWTDLTFQDKSGFWRNFSMTSREILYTKNAMNELFFLLVTHTSYFDTRFGRYGFLKSGYGADQILDRLVI